MNWKITEVEKIVAPVGGSFWVQTHDFTPDEEHEKERKGRLLAILGVENRSNLSTVEMVELGREVLARLHEHYFGGFNDLGILYSLKRAVEKLKEEFMEMIHVGVMVESKNFIYVVMGGGVECFVNLHNKHGFLKSKEDVEVKSFCKEKGEDFQLVIGTKKFWNKFGEGRILGVLENENGVRELGDELAIGVGSGEDSSGIGAVIVKIDREEGEISEMKPTVTKKWKLPIFNFEGSGYVLRERRKRGTNKKVFGWIGIGIFVLLLIVGGIWKSRVYENKQRLQSQETKVEQGLKEIELLADYNQSKAAEKLLELKTDILELEKRKDKKAVLLIEKVKEIEDRIAGKIKVQFNEIANLDLVRTGMKGTQMVFEEVSALVLDENMGKLAEFNPGTGAVSIVAGGVGIDGGKRIAYNAGTVFLVGSKGEFECEKRTWACTKKIESSELPSRITDVKVWAGNLYILDGEMGKIWKYSKAGEVYKKIAWTTGEDALLQGATNMMIDGQIWVTTGKGDVVAYSLGSKTNFQTNQQDDLVISPGATIFTTADDDLIYVLDGNNERILLFKKNGEYVKQMKNDLLKQANNLVVLSSTKKIYVTIGSKIYSADLP